MAGLTGELVHHWSRVRLERRPRHVLIARRRFQVVLHGRGGALPPLNLVGEVAYCDGRCSSRNRFALASSGRAESDPLQLSRRLVKYFRARLTLPTFWAAAAAPNRP